MEVERIPQKISAYDSRELDRAEGKAVNQLREYTKAALPDPDLWLTQELERNIFITTLDYLLNWGRRSSVWPVNFSPACCAFELIATAASRFDISRFGMELLRASPRQADLMIVGGTVTWKLAPAVKRIYAQMPEPKWVIAMGACSISGGTFAHSYSVVPGVNNLIPVDVYIPGCPPRPEALLNGIIKIHKKIAKDSLLRHR